MSEQLRHIAAAVRELEKKKRLKAFDAYNLDSRPNKKQQLILSDINKVKMRYVVAGNQCLPEGTLIATPTGLKEVQDIRPGDMVYDQDGLPIQVEANFDNGEAEVVELVNRGIVWGESTLNHVWLTKNSSNRTSKEEELCLEQFRRDTQVKRISVNLPLGTVDCKDAYVIGALLGDGCSRTPGVVISSEDNKIPQYIGQLLNAEVTAPKSSNSWRIKGSPKISYYQEWCQGRYAHEKTCDIDIIKTWNRDSLVRFVAGLIDTDGSVFVDGWDNLTISIAMQALPVIEAVKYAMLALWQTPVTITLDDRDKYKNGPLYSIKVASNAFSKRMVKELSPYLQTERKQYKSEYDKLVSTRSSSDYIGIKLGQKRTARVYDIRVSSERSLYLTATGLVTHNSGKSQLAAREIAWILTDTNPYWQRPESWADQSLVILIAAQDLTMAATELWGQKIAPFLDQDEWRLEKQGNTLKRVVNKKTKDQIVFLSHSDGSEKNRKHMQGYTAHYVWLDEMPASKKILEELQRRIDARNGYFLATFTPKFKSDDIRRIIDASEPPVSQKYQMSKLDNPIYAERLEDEIKKLAGYTEAEKRTILYGDWSTGDAAVYQFDYEFMTIQELPSYYNRGWRHVESVDPALRSKCGYTLWAEDPQTGVWYLIQDEYIEGTKALDPDSLVQQVLERSKGYNVVRRISDSMAWFTSTAQKYGASYMIPYSKNSRKDELIKGLQTALSTGKIKIGRWCTAFIDEVQSCQFREESDVIVNSSIYHTLDCAQYFCDATPKFDPIHVQKEWHVELREANAKRKSIEAKKAKGNQMVSNRAKSMARGWGRRGFKIR